MLYAQSVQIGRKRARVVSVLRPVSQQLYFKDALFNGVDLGAKRPDPQNASDRRSVTIGLVHARSDKLDRLTCRKSE